MSLSIKTIDLVFSFTVKALIWKISLVTSLNLKSDRIIVMHLDSGFIILGLSDYPLVKDIPNEMIVSVRI